jgi:predicted aspartyl protease
MGRIVTSVTIKNASDSSQGLRCDALVDTGAAYVTLPSAWKERLGTLEEIRTVELEIATQKVIEGAICGPVRIQIEGFAPIFGEVLFMDMTPTDGIDEPLVGYIPLEQSQAAVDMLGHRLVPGKRVDLKGFHVSESQTFNPDP